MKARLVAAVWLASGLALAFGRVEPLLPNWDEAEIDARLESGWVPGSVLLTEGPVAEEVPELDVERPTAEELAGSEVPANEIPEEFWPEYFNERPERFLVDPQGLLSSVDYRDPAGVSELSRE